MLINRSFINDISYSVLCIHLNKQPIACVLSYMFYKRFAKFVGKHLCWSLFFSKLQAWSMQFMTTETPTQVRACEYNEIFKNTFFLQKSLIASAHLCRLFSIDLLTSTKKCFFACSEAASGSVLWKKVS